MLLQSFYIMLILWYPISGIATIYVRYKQVSALNPEEPKMLRLNKAGLVIGMVSCFGVCIIANFQKNAVFFLHTFGAFLTFGIGVIYILIQTILSYKMQPEIHGKDIFWIRLTILLWCAVSILSMSISSVTLLSLNGIDSLRKQHWDPQEKGYAFHIISTVSEWSLAFTFLGFFFTFIRDFQKISLHTETSLLGPNFYDMQEQLLADDQGIPITGST
ncbi:DNA damage-regulated autophagy modulator protein 2 isoform X2 [Candoia aspera]|uniref:DNA damage-regulated autophagy modulator protein 2 isoform X2 n=1 Tax=Candoia aspera TaxID=51853 RepID=UPI002FD83BA1